MPGSPGEAELLSQAAAGDQTAFAMLVEPHQRAMFRHCYRMLGSGADAEDATQDALVRAWQKPAIPSGVMAASEPPAIMASASPRRMTS